VSAVRSPVELAKLWKLTIPKYDETYYYVHTLSLSKEWQNIWDKVKEFAELEDWLEDKGIHSVGKYKGTLSKDIRDYIKATEAFTRFTKFDMDSFTYAHPLKGTTDTRTKYFDGETVLLSIDINSANYTIFTLFDEKGEMGTSWLDFCSKQKDMHPIMTKAKIFRQVIFGELNSSRNSKIQSRVTLSIYSHLIEKFGISLAEKLVFLSHDELVFQFGKETKESLQWINQVNTYLDTTTVPITSSDTNLHARAIHKGKHFKTTVYRMKALDDAGSKAVKTVLSVQDTDGESSYVEQHKSLFGVSASQFFMHFKRYVLNMPVEERDLYFVSEGRLAKWVV